MTGTPRGYVLGLLTAVYSVSTADQALISLLLEPIRNDLRLSDSQLGLLSGPAFGVVYAILGLPMARWSDRGNRIWIVSGALALWSATLMGSAVIVTFSQLVIMRMLTATAEAGCMPPSYSLVGDYFPGSAERARAMTVYMLGNPISMLLGFAVGAWLDEAYGWRGAFVGLAVPALAVAALIRLTVREPREAAKVQPLEDAALGIIPVLGGLWRLRTARHLTVALILLYTMGFGLAPWYGVFMIREHGAATEELGVWLGCLFGFGGMAGVALGGYVVNRWLKTDERSQLRLIAASVALLVPLNALFLLVPGKLAAFLALVPFMLMSVFFSGPTYALLQRLVRPEVRATTLALVMLLYNLIGIGAGPQLVGLLSDWLRSADSLRYAMLCMSMLPLASAIYFWRASQSVGTDLAIEGQRSEPSAPLHEITTNGAA
jgi:predicted MFS family arabinose efflux permease